MTEQKRYYITYVNLEDVNHAPYYNIRDRKKEGNNVLFMVSGKYTSKDIVNKLNEQEEQVKKIKQENKMLKNNMDKLIDESLDRALDIIRIRIEYYKKEDSLINDMIVNELELLAREIKDQKIL